MSERLDGDRPLSPTFARDDIFQIGDHVGDGVVYSACSREMQGGTRQAPPEPRVPRSGAAPQSRGSICVFQGRGCGTASATDAQFSGLFGLGATGPRGPTPDLHRVPRSLPNLAGLALGPEWPRVGRSWCDSVLGRACAESHRRARSSRNPYVPRLTVRAYLA